MTRAIFLLAGITALGHALPNRHCVDSAIVDLLKHDIAYYRHFSKGGPFSQIKNVRLMAWARDELTAFYLLDHLPHDDPSFRVVLWYQDDELVNSSGCTTNQTWQACIEGSPTLQAYRDSQGRARTCRIDVNVAAIPPWKPSPDNATKRRIAREIAAEVERAWGPSGEIVARDFNLRDPDIMIYMRASDGSDGYTHCGGFRAWKTPHCLGWPGFGQASPEGLKREIFAHPYKLK
jgi:uncharacterized protein (DUF736 family)